MSLRLAMLSVHTCPLAAPGGKETGGMNVYVRELSRELGRMGVEVDVYTRSQNPAIPRVVALGERAHVIHLTAGPEAPMPRERLADHLDEFVDGVEEWRIARGDYDLIYAHYWLSGEAGLALRARWGVPVLQMFHTLARLKNSVARSPGEIEPLRRIETETRLVRAVDRIVAANRVERDHLVRHYGAESTRIAIIPCGVDTGLFRPGDGAAARRASGSTIARWCSTSDGSSPSRVSTSCSMPWRPCAGADCPWNSWSSAAIPTSPGRGTRHTCAGSSRSASWARAFAFSDPSPRTSSASTTWPRT